MRVSQAIFRPQQSCSFPAYNAILPRYHRATSNSFLGQPYQTSYRPHICRTNIIKQFAIGPVFILEGALSVDGCVSSIKTGTRRVWTNYLPLCVVQDEQQKIVRLDACVLSPSLYKRRIIRPTTNVCPSSSRRIMRPL